MSVVKRYNKLLNLDNIDVLVDEVDVSDHIIISELPESLPQGRSSFLIEVSPYMRDGVELQIDIIDSEGKSIYSEPVENHLEGTSRRVSIEVYGDTAPGVATMIIVGELDALPLGPGAFSEYEEVPKEWEGVYNIRLTKNVIINTAALNTQPIKFYSTPKLHISETRLGSLELESTITALSSSIIELEGIPMSGREFTPFPSSTDTSTKSEKQGTKDRDEKSLPDGRGKTDIADIETRKQSSKKQSTRKSSHGRRSGRVARRSSPIQYPYSFTIVSGSHTFDTQQIGGTITFETFDTSIYNADTFRENGLGHPDNVSANIVQLSHDRNYPYYYTASISDLGNSTTALVSTPFTRQTTNGEYKIIPLKATGVVHYESEPSASYSTANIISYANVKMSDLRTFSGDVFKTKVYVRSEGSWDDFQLLTELPLEAPEFMINSGSVGVGERTGYFISQEDVTNYWNVYGGTNGLSAAGPETSASYDNDTLLDSIELSGSISEFSDQIRFQLKDDYRFNLEDNIDYTLSFTAVGRKSAVDKALMMLYVSGSSVYQSNKLHNDTFFDGEVLEPTQYGKRLGVLEVNTSDQPTKEFGLVKHNFNVDLTGDAIIQFRIISGIWNISDVSIRPSADTGFSPSFIEFSQQLPPNLQHKRPDTLEFLAEFYDINNNLADTISFTTGSVFTGPNLVITGDDNNMSGDLFLGGDTTGSGVHMGGVNSTLPETGGAGAEGSGFIRSVGYQGFMSASNQDGDYGFMIYSGSVLPDSGDSYAGVGLELIGVSGSLKFRTNPSVFEVIADAFYVGSSDTQFISGSSGQIEISSSNFHLSPSGDVNMTGTVTAQAGDIAGWLITTGSDGRSLLSGSNITLDASGSSIFMSDKGPRSDVSYPNGFEPLADEYYMDFTPSGSDDSAGYYVKFGPNFSVDHEGILIASGAKFEGTITASAGMIGGWQIEDTYLGSVPDGVRLYGGGTPYVISSSNFQVTSDGDVSGSQVLFTGGKIGGFNIGASTLTNVENTVELSTILPGLKIKDNTGTSRVEVKSGSFSDIGGGTQHIGNEGFEETGSLSAGRNFNPTVASWSYSMGGHVTASLTDRSGYSDFEKAVSGDISFDVVIPSGAANYSSNNTYELSQVITASIAEGDTLSFSAVARFSSSFGTGKERALQPQYYIVEYSSSNSNGWTPFLPSAAYTSSNGYAEYFLGAGQYNSFGGSAAIPEACDYLRVTVTGSINDDGGFTVEAPLFAKAKAGKWKEDSTLGKKKYNKVFTNTESPEYPETEITFDSFRLKSNTRKIEMTQDGLLIYNSEDSFIKMTSEGIEIQGGSGVSAFSTAINREAFTNDSQIAGTLAAPQLQADANVPSNIGTSSAAGDNAFYSRGNHIHGLPFSTLNTVVNGQTFDSLNVTALTSSNVLFTDSGILSQSSQVDHDQTANFDANEHFTQTNITTVGTVTSGNVDAILPSNLLSGSAQIASDISGSLGTNASLIRSLTAVGITGSFTSLSQSLAARIATEEAEVGDISAVNVSGTGLSGGGSSGDVTVTITPSDVVSAVGGFSGSAQVDHDSTTNFSSDEHFTQANITTVGTVTAGSVTAILPTDTVSGSAQIASDISGSWTSDRLPAGTVSGSSQIDHNSTTNYDADSHIDHTGVGITAGSGMTGGGTIDSSLTLNVIGGDGITANANDIEVDSTVLRTTGDNIISSSAQVDHDSTTNFVANEHINHTSVSIAAGSGLTGGGTIASNRTINIGSGTGITVNADSIQTNDSAIVHDNLSGFVSNEHINHTSVTLTAGAGLNGGGDISTNRTFSVDSGSMAAYYSSSAFGTVTGDVLITDAGVSTIQTTSVENSMLAGSIANSKLSNSSVNYGGITLSLGGSDTTPAFNLSDATALPIVAGTTGTLSVARGGTGATTLNNLITLGTHTTGNYVATLTGGTGITSTGATSGEGITHSISVDASQTQITELGTITTGVWNGTAIDISSYTNLVAGTNITLSGDTLNVDDAFLINSGDDTTSGTITAAGLITSGNISGSSNSTGSFGTIKVDDTTKVTNLNADLLDGQTGTYYTDFSNQVIDDDEIPIAKLAQDAVTITAGDGLKTGGSVTLGSSVTLNIDVSDFAGTGLEDDGSENLRLTTQGAGLFGGNGSLLSVDSGSMAAYFSSSAFSTITGDVLITDAGVSTIQATSVENSMLAGSIANAKLSNSSVNYGGITLSLGGSDTTPAFNLSDATALPIVAGTTGTLSVARGGTGATTLNNLITLGTHTTGNYVATLTGGTGITSTGATSGEGIAHSISVDASQTQITGLGTITTGTWNASPIDISSYTNLVAGTNITLSGDTLNVDDAFLINSGDDTTSGTITAAGLITSGNVSGSSTSTGSFGYGYYADKVGIGTTEPSKLLHVAGDAKIDGTLTAQEFHTEFVSASIVYESGSTKFGDTSDDIHQFSGSLRVTGSGNHYFTNGNVGIGTDLPGQLLTIRDSAGVGSATYQSGFAGSGWQISGSAATATFDNLTVRGTMDVYELLIHQIRATNGSIWVSNTGKVSESIGGGGNTYTMSFDTGNAYGHGFAADDLIMFQRWDNASNSTQLSRLTVDSVPDTGSIRATLETGDTAPQSGYEYVRVGSTSDSSRQGAIYITADDQHAPYIDVIDGVTAHGQFSQSSYVKTRTGKLDGITSPTLGDLSGYGFYASGSAYLEGSVNATNGEIGGWTIGTNLSATNMRLNPSDSIELGSATTYAAGDGIWLGNDGTARFGNASAARFQWDLTNVEIYDSSDQKLVSLGGTNEIVGWELVPGRFQYDNASGSIALDATNKQISIYTGSIDTAKPKVVMGNLPTTGTAYYGFAVFSGSANADINDDSTYSVLITKDAARLAGWDLVPGRLKSGTVADINGNQASIALGTGASTATGTPTDGLFFVSASTSPVFYVGSTFSYVDDVLTAGGWKIGNGQISSSNGNAILSGSGVLSLGNGTHGYAQADRTYIDGPNNRMSIGQNFTYVSDVLSVAGWTVSSGYMSTGTGDGQISLVNQNWGNLTYNGDDAGGLVFGAPQQDIENTTGSAFVVNTANDSFFRAGDTNNYIKWDGVNGQLSLEGSNVIIGANVKVSGSLKAIDGTIGGWSISDNKIQAGSSGMMLSGSGVISASSFYVDEVGNVTASNADFSGAVNAESGNIGGTFGWTIAAGKITSVGGTASVTLDSKNGKIYIGTGTYNNSNTPFYADGSSNFSLGDQLTFDGSSLTLSGTVTATAGTIGGFTITSDKISKSLGASNPNLVLRADEAMIDFSIGETPGLNFIGASTISTFSNLTGYDGVLRFAGSDSNAVPLIFIGGEATDQAITDTTTNAFIATNGQAQIYNTYVTPRTISKLLDIKDAQATDANVYGVYVDIQKSVTVNNYTDRYGGYFDVTTAVGGYARDDNYGIYAKASGAGRDNYAGYFADGDVKIENKLTVSSLVVNGSNRNYESHILNGGFNYGYATGTNVWMPINGTLSEVTSTQTGEYNQFIAPYDGYVEKVMVRSEEVGGSTVVSCYAVSNGTEYGTLSTPFIGRIATDTQTMSVDDTSYTFTFGSGSADFTAGQSLSFAIDPTNDLNDTWFTVVLKLDPST